MELPPPTPELKKEALLETLRDEFRDLDNASAFVSVALTVAYGLYSYLPRVLERIKRDMGEDPKLDECINKHAVSLGLQALAWALLDIHGCCESHNLHTMAVINSMCPDTANALVEAIKQEPPTDGDVTDSGAVKTFWSGR